jgi:levansucrase
MNPTRTPVADGGQRGTSSWTREQAERIERNADNVAPIIYPPETDPFPELHIWDTWFLRTRDGSLADLNGWRVAVSLTAPADLLPGKRHDVATLRYFYSSDGQTWHRGGRVFEESEAFGSRQWAGSALYDDGDLYFYYTASGQKGEEELTYQQRLAVGHGSSVVADDEGVEFSGPFEHEILLTPDGDYYETEDQSRGMIYTFRDPWFFEDPETGKTHLLFEGNTPVPEGSDACGGDAAQQEFNGCIGLATSESGDPTDWEMQPPLVEGVCVNQELERPHVVVRDGQYYLFTPSHEHTFAPGLHGFDALYGFVADSLEGEYRPLNDSGLVLANPTNAPFQAYSWLAFRHREEILVHSFFNYYDLRGRSLDDVADLPESEQQRRFGGNFAPTVRLGVDGDETWVRGVLDYGHIPTEDEELEEPFEPDRDRPTGGY